MTTTHDTLRTFARDFYDTLTAKIGADGLDDLVDVLDEIDERYDDGEMAAAAEHWNGALMLAYGNDTLAGLAAARRAAHAAYLAAHERMLGAIIHSARIGGLTEAQIVREVGMNRGTVRKALGLTGGASAKDD